MGFLKFMKSTGYALHGVVYLARRAEQQPILLREIAEALQMPENYMAKIFQSLSKAGLVTASRGAHRGYRLARPAGEISLLDVVELHHLQPEVATLVDQGGELVHIVLRHAPTDRMGMNVNEHLASSQSGGTIPSNQARSPFCSSATGLL